MLENILKSAPIVGPIITALALIWAYKSHHQNQKLQVSLRSFDKAYSAIFSVKNIIAELYDIEFILSLLPLQNQSLDSRKILLSHLIDKRWNEYYISNRIDIYKQAKREFYQICNVHFFVLGGEIYSTHQKILSKLDNSSLLKEITSTLLSIWSLHKVFCLEESYLIVEDVNNLDEIKRKIMLNKINSDNLKNLQNSIFQLQQRKAEIQNEHAEFMSLLADLEELFAKKMQQYRS